MLEREVRLAREAGALDQMPVSLGALGTAEAIALTEATIAAATTAGQGIAVAYAHRVAAIVANGPGRYTEAQAAAGAASADTSAIYPPTWALPELIEAAARSANPGPPAYGDRPRREDRRGDARTQLREAHDPLDQIGMQAFAERARHAHPADRAGGAHRPAVHQRPDRLRTALASTALAGQVDHGPLGH